MLQAQAAEATFAELGNALPACVSVCRTVA